MKKFLLLAALAIGFAGVASAQIVQTAPRFDSTGTTGDNTGRVLNWKYATIVPHAGTVDTSYVYPGAWETIYRITLPSGADSCRLVLNGANSKVGDVVKLIVTGPNSGYILVTPSFPSYIYGKQTITLSTAGSAIATFTFNGTVFAQSGDKEQ